LTPRESPYTDDVLCADWRPLALALREAQVQVQKPAVDAVDAETFLARHYLTQQA
jgi:hypothetical protein